MEAEQEKLQQLLNLQELLEGEDEETCEVWNVILLVTKKVWNCENHWLCSKW